MAESQVITKLRARLKRRYRAVVEHQRKSKPDSAAWALAHRRYRVTQKTLVRQIEGVPLWLIRTTMLGLKTGVWEYRARGNA